MSAVLIVEDEKHLADGLRYNLKAEGYEVDVAASAEEAYPLLTQAPQAYDVVVLDVMLPGMDGFSLASRLRAQGHFVPILMLTARDAAHDVLRGFESGADDYLPKPFDLSVLLARINALLRRRDWFRKDRNKTNAGVFNIGKKTLDFENLELRSEEETVHLTLMEAELLRYLIDHDGKIVSRSAILEDVWALREDTDTRAIDNFIVRLRKYLEDEPSRPRHLLPVRRYGYRFISANSRQA